MVIQHSCDGKLMLYCLMANGFLSYHFLLRNLWHFYTLFLIPIIQDWLIRVPGIIHCQEFLVAIKYYYWIFIIEYLTSVSLILIKFYSINKGTDLNETIKLFLYLKTSLQGCDAWDKQYYLSLKNWRLAGFCGVAIIYCWKNIVF